MKDAIEGMTFLGLSGHIIAIVVAVLLFIEIVVCILDFKGKVVLEFINIRAKLRKNRKEKQNQKQLLLDLQTALNEMKDHYSPENLAKRNDWMTWVNNRAQVYDEALGDLIAMHGTMEKVTEALNSNTKMTEDLFVENSRDRIIDFSEKASDYTVTLSQEQFRRIFKIYENYELFLKEHGRTNGEIDIAYMMIQDGYKYRTQHHCFVEDISGYEKK